MAKPYLAKRNHKYIEVDKAIVLWRRRRKRAAKASRMPQDQK